jgi:predicted phage terminase large subunit-like protein
MEIGQNSAHLDAIQRSNAVNPDELARILGPDAWRLTPATFAHHITNGDWIPARHLLKASSEIAAAVSKGNARLIVAWPPRHGKSELMSVNTPIWFLDNWPNRKVAMCSYGSDLIEDFSIRVRDTILEHESVGDLNVKLKKDRLRVDNFHTTQNGAVYAVGIGGPLTGRGAHLLLIDDYLKNAKDASSKGVRDDIFNWFVSVAMTRLEPGASVIIFAARWDTDDLAGRLIREAPHIWKVIRFSAICDEENDALGRSIGEPLWPERVPLDRLDALRATLGKFFWNALYQQRPLKKAEKLTRDAITIVLRAPPWQKLRLVRYWDFASTQDGGDFTVGILMAEEYATGLTYILDVQRGQWSPAKIEEVVKLTAERDMRNWRRVQTVIEQEPGSAGKALVGNFIRKVLKGYSVYGRPASGQGSKEFKRQPFLAQVEGRTVNMLEADWNKDFLDELELVSEGQGEFDDQIDSAAGGFNYLMEKAFRKGTFGRNKRTAGIIKPTEEEVAAINAEDKPRSTQRATFGRKLLRLS